MSRTVRLSIAAALLGAAALAVPQAAQAQTPPPESGNCKVQVSGSGYATLSADAAQCHIDVGDPGATAISVSYVFTSSDGQNYKYEKNCAKNEGLDPCLKKISHTFKDPAGTQTFTVNAFVEYQFPLGGYERSDHKQLSVKH